MSAESGAWAQGLPKPPRPCGTDACARADQDSACGFGKEIGESEMKLVDGHALPSKILLKVESRFTADLESSMYDAPQGVTPGSGRE